MHDFVNFVKTIMYLTYNSIYFPFVLMPKVVQILAPIISKYGLKI
jgi:hypothetical protein